MSQNMNDWFPLDNAAKIYPAIVSKKNSVIYRVAFILKEIVQKDVLQSALEKTVKRYPTMEVKIKKGLFWYYFETNTNTPKVQQEVLTPCVMIDPKQTQGYLFRILYNNKRIALECFHSLTDGYGAIEFLKTLVYEYLRLLGYEIDAEDMVKPACEYPKKYELEDSFLKYYNPKETVGWKEEHAQHITGTLLESGQKVVHGVMDASRLNAFAKQKGVTLTEYLTTILALSIYEENMKFGVYKKPIKISVPVNLRGVFASKTLRNFSSYINVQINIYEPLTFDTVAKQVTDQLKHGVKKENLYRRINANVKAERNYLMRVVPLFIKNIVLRQVNHLFGSKLISTNLSNLGIIRVPESMAQHIVLCECVLNANPIFKISCSMCSVNNKLCITFSRCILEKDIIRRFFKTIADESNIDIEIFSNEPREYNNE